MSAERPIAVGDLVVFVRSCCIGFRNGASIFRVAEIITLQGAICEFCNRRLPSESYASISVGDFGAPFSWLKRIPPLSDLEGVRTEEPMHQPKETA